MKTWRSLVSSVLASTLTALMLVIVTTGLTMVPFETAHAWFGCGNGTLETQGNPPERVRCRIRGQDAGCPVGMQLRVDAMGNIDRCVPPVGPDGEASCAPGHSKQLRQGRDRCYRYTRPS